MLSRTADHLFWMARYTERAENTARLLDVNVQTAMLPQSAEDAEHGWRAMLSISETGKSRFDEKYDTRQPGTGSISMVRDPVNHLRLLPACAQPAKTRAVCGTPTTKGKHKMRPPGKIDCAATAWNMIPASFSNGSSTVPTCRAA